MASPFKPGDLVTFNYIKFWPQGFPWYRSKHRPELDLLNGSTGQVTRALVDRVTVQFTATNPVGQTIIQKHQCYPFELTLVFAT